jgi:hypothetical protein
MRMRRRLLPLAVVRTVAVSTACAAVTWALSAAMRIPLAEAHADICLISGVQGLCPSARRTPHSPGSKPGRLAARRGGGVL